MNVDLELYRVFCEVVKYKSITKTAENIHISQSAVTQSIHKLEKMLGGNVFYRNKKGVELTEEGKKLYEFIKDSIETMSNAENLFSQNLKLESGKIRIGGGDTQIDTIIIDPLIKFINNYPNIEIYITPGKTNELIQKVSNGELDIITTRRNPDEIKQYSNIDFIPLRSCKYCFFASKKYLNENKIKNIKDIKEKKVFVPKPTTTKNEIFEKCCEFENIELSNKYQIASSYVVKNMVLKNAGIGFIDSNNLIDIKDKIEIIKEIEIKDNIEGIVTLNKKMCNKATLEFIKYIKENLNIK